MPFPATRTVHPRWSEHHQGAAAGTLSGLLQALGPASGGGWDPKTGPAPQNPGDVLHSGPFRAQPLADTGQPGDATGQNVTVRGYLIQLEADAPALPIGTRVKILQCPDDTAFVGKVLTVTAPAFSTHRFTRDIYAELDLSNQEA